jgi:predicted lipoprotein with Yx(FWY)xxD motif
MRYGVKAACVLVASLGLIATGCGEKHKAVPSSGGYAQPSSAGPESSPPMSSESPGEASPSAGPESSPPMSSESPGGPVEVKAKDTSLGKILVDQKDMTLYLFEKDKGGKPTCTDACEADWPPLTTDQKPTAGTGVNPAWLGTTDRPDGTKQVTYHGWPLYHYAKDTKPGDMAGQGVTAFGGPWYVVDATKGEKLKKK